jgi:lactoylglutathione lyase
MRYLHTMLRVRNLDAALDFYVNKLGLKETRRRVDEKGRYTLVFLVAPGDEKVEETKKEGRPGLEVELTYNWDGDEDYGEARYFGHLAYEVDDIYAACDHLLKAGVTINRRATASWLSCARPTSTLSSCCRRAPPNRHRNRGSRCLIPGTGKLAAGREALYTSPRCLRPPCPRNRQPGMRPSSRGPGHRPFTAATGVRIP